MIKFKQTPFIDLYKRTFDWLRKDERTIIGIRTCFFEHQEYNALLEKFKYTKSTYGEKFIEILFTTEGYNPLLSGDQDFTNNYVYTSDNGDYLFTFGLDHLTEYELNSLLKHCEILT